MKPVPRPNLALAPCVLAVLAAVLAPVPVTAQDTPPGQAAAPVPVVYERHVAPILRTYCAGCHNDRDREGELSVETFARLRAGGDMRGDPIRPGDPDESFLIKSLEGRARPKMPPKDEPQVPAAELETLRRWIREGAAGPARDDSILETLITPAVPPSEDPSPLTAVEVSPDGRRIAMGRSGSVEIRQRATGALERVLDGIPGKVNAVHFSPDGRRLAVATGVPGLHGVAWVIDAGTGAQERVLGGHRDVLYDAEFSPDGALLATAGYDRVIRIWNVSDGAPLQTIDVHKGAIFDLAWHPAGTVLASASADETVKLWRVSDGVRLDTLNQPQGEMIAVRFTPDGDFVLAAGADRRIHMWRFVSRDAPALNPVEHSRFAHDTPIDALALSADGRFVVSSAADRSLKLWSLPDLRLLHAYESQSDLVPAMAPVPGTDQVIVVRMDGSSGTVTIPAAARQTAGAVAEAVAASTPAAPAGPSSPGPSDPEDRRAGTGAETLSRVAEREPNNTPDHATAVTLPAEATGAVASPGDADLFRFRARAGERLILEVNAARSKSKLDSRVEVLHSDGRPVEQVVLQATRDSWFTFRGKDSDTSDDFRVHNWAEMELDEYLYANGEVVRLWLYPRGPDSGFKVYPGEGRRQTYFSTTPLVHALGEPCYIVTPLPPGSAPAPNGLPVFRLNYVNDDDPQRRHGTDSVLLFTAPAEAAYLARVTDVRGFGAETDFTYSLSIRPPRPDFKVTVSGLNPKVSPGSGRELVFKAERHEGFEGPIRIDLENLPAGFTASAPVEIEAGQISAVAVLMAGPDAADPDNAADEAVKVTASAWIEGREVRHALGNLGNLQIGDPPKLLVEILPSSDRAAVTTRPDGRLEFAIRPGQTISARVRAERRGFEGRIELGNEDSGRNLPHGLYVDNIGLNGLLIVEGQNEREFFITASRIARPGTRLFHLRARADDGQASRPAVIRVLSAERLARAP